MSFLKILIPFCSAMLFCLTLTQAQCPQGEVTTLETQADVDNFAVLYPDCTEIANVLEIGTTNDSDITDLSPLSQIVSIGANLVIEKNSNLLSLNGLESLTSIGGDLFIEVNANLVNLIGLDNLTSIGGLLIYNNENLVNLNGLENVASIENLINISTNNNLINLSGLEKVISLGNYLSISENGSLSSLSGLEKLTSIGGQLRINDNDNLVNFRGLERLTSVGDDFWIDDNDGLINFNGLESLTLIEGVILIQDNITLSSLSGLQNMDYNTIITLDILGNQMLSVCNFPSVCSYIENGGNTAIFDNAPGCNNPTEISANCSVIPKIRMDIFYDANQNEIQDNNELNYYDISMLIAPGGNSYYTQNNGIFYIQPGNYTVTFDTANNPNWQLTTDSLSYFLSLVEGETDTVTFGIYPEQQISHIQTTINSAPARCNETITLDVTTKNIGTTIASGTMWLTIDEAIPEFSFIHQPDTILESVDTYYGWYFTDLYPGQSITKNVQVTVPGPPGFDLGEQLLFVSFSQFTDANGDDTSEGFRYNPEVRCSYDPNDKLVNPNRESDYVLFEEDLIYTIRFQNTGNDVAYDVVIRDTLDANLDLSTFRLLGSSHANRLNTTLSDEGILTFEFRDIFLPDSTTNFEASQGYVNYLIHTIDGLAEETPVTNSAGIYFDLNPPVITNTTQSIMVSELPTVSTELPDSSLDFNISPNPNTGVFNIQGIPTGTYQILNTSGQIIRQGDMQNDLQIDISRETQGVYFISVTIDNEVFVQRMVKM